MMVYTIVVLVGLFVRLGYTIESDPLLKPQFEAAFQGRCGHGSPCEQLCYELHDGMYECDCREGYELHQDGYSCYELNATMSPTIDGVEGPAAAPMPALGKEEDVLYQRDASFSAQLSVVETNNGTLENGGGINSTTVTWKEYDDRNDYDDTSVTMQSPKLDQKVPSAKVILQSTQSLSETSSFETQPSSTTSSTTTVPMTESPCPLDCGPGGACGPDDSVPGAHRCQCPLGRGGDLCEKELTVRSPRFSGRGWLAFPALRAAYKHVQLTMELRPEAYDGIFFLTGERDDMAGDFMALLLHQGFVEFRFDCGSGVGVVRSEETVLLNQWNRLTLYRHRWDAWLQLNGGKHVKGRSKGLFSRITFREPLFIGGPGNTTGLSDKLPVSTGLRGCVRHLEVNDHSYRFALTPNGDASKGFGVQECTADRCSRVPCQHGGKCVTSTTIRRNGNGIDDELSEDDEEEEEEDDDDDVDDEGGAVCVCPLGFAGDLCETRVDLQVPAFNGSSYLRYRGLSHTALSWLDLQITLKPAAAHGVVLYNGHHVDATGDFMAVYMNDGHLEFAFDLGTGSAVVRSEQRLSLGEWHEVKISRTGRLAWLQVDAAPATEVWSPGAFTQLSLPQNLYIGGVPNFSIVSPSVRVRVRTSFVGCIQKVVINNRPLGILAEALGGANVDNCPHPCVARPCGEDGTCVPNLDYFTCHCKPGYRDAQCSQRGGNYERVVAKSKVETIPQIPHFSGHNSFLHFTDSDTIERLTGHRTDINIRFKVSDGDGLLLWTDRMSLGLEKGAIVLRHKPVAGAKMLVYNLTRVDDDLWHRLRAVWTEGGGSLEVDSAPVVTAAWAASAPRHPPYSGLYVGGAPNSVLHRGIIGCVADLVLDSEFHVQLIAMSAVGRNVGRCNPGV